MRAPSPPTVLSSLALFVALAGTGVAQDAVNSAKRLVTGKQIKRGAVASKHVKDGSLTRADLATGVITAAPDAYTKGESDGRFQPKGNYQAAGDYLPSGGKAADAEALDGLDGTVFARRSLRSGSGMTDEGAEVTLIDVPGQLTVKGQCIDGTPPTARLRYDYGVQWELALLERSGSNPSLHRGVPDLLLGPGAPSQFDNPSPGVGHRVVLKLGRDGFSRVLVTEAHGTPVGNFDCDFAGFAYDLERPPGG